MHVLYHWSRYLLGDGHQLVLQGLLGLLLILHLLLKVLNLIG